MGRMDDTAMSEGVCKRPSSHPVISSARFGKRPKLNGMPARLGINPQATKRKPSGAGSFSPKGLPLISPVVHHGAGRMDDTAMSEGVCKRPSSHPVISSARFGKRPKLNGMPARLGINPQATKRKPLRGWVF